MGVEWGSSGGDIIGVTQWGCHNWGDSIGVKQLGWHNWGDTIQVTLLQWYHLGYTFGWHHRDDTIGVTILIWHHWDDNHKVVKQLSLEAATVWSEQFLIKWKKQLFFNFTAIIFSSCQITVLNMLYASNASILVPCSHQLLLQCVVIYLLFMLDIMKLI